MSEFVIEGDVLKKYEGNDLTVIVPDGIKHIDSCAFAKCGMEKVVLPEGLESIDNAAFIACDGLDYIRLPSSTKSIGKRAFFGCSNLKHVFMSSSQINIDESAFQACKRLEDENGCVIINNELFDCRMGGDVVVPNGVERIRRLAFHEMRHEITSISLPKTLVKIDENACEFTNKNKVYITASTTDIADDAFCPSTTTICAPIVSVAHKYAKKNSIAFSSISRDHIEKTYADICAIISEKRQEKQAKKFSRLHEKRIGEYGIKVEHIDGRHFALYLKNGMDMPYEMPFYIEDGLNIAFITDAIKNLVKNIDEGEGKFIFTFAPSGAGKSHLLNLIYKSMKDIYPEKNIHFSEAMPYITEVRDRIENGTASEVNVLCENDVLLLDNCPNPAKCEEVVKKIMRICAESTVLHGGICVYTFSYDEELSFNEIDWLDNICPEKTTYFGMKDTTDEITNYFYAKKYSEKYGYNIAEDQLARISEEAENLAEVRKMVSECCNKNR